MSTGSPQGPVPAAAPTLYTDLFNGTGQVRVWSLLQGASGPFTAVLSCELAPAGSVGRHVQQEFPEVVLGLAGEGEARVDGAPHRLDPCSAIYLPLGATLEIVNRSDRAPLRYVIVKARER